VRKYINLPCKRQKTSQTSEHCPSCKERWYTIYKKKQQQYEPKKINKKPSKNPDNTGVPVHNINIPKNALTCHAFSQVGRMETINRNPPTPPMVHFQSPLLLASPPKKDQMKVLHNLLASQILQLHIIQVYRLLLQ